MKTSWTQSQKLKRSWRCNHLLWVTLTMYRVREYHLASSQVCIPCSGWTAMLRQAVLLQSVQTVTLWTNPPASSVHGIIQARILEWVACPTAMVFPYFTDGSMRDLFSLKVFFYETQYIKQPGALLFEALKVWRTGGSPLVVGYLFKNLRNCETQCANLKPIVFKIAFKCSKVYTSVCW